MTHAQAMDIVIRHRIKLEPIVSVRSKKEEWVAQKGAVSRYGSDPISLIEEVCKAVKIAVE